jgi:hypothetical protein
MKYGTDDINLVNLSTYDESDAFLGGKFHIPSEQQ